MVFENISYGGGIRAHVVERNYDLSLLCFCCCFSHVFAEISFCTLLTLTEETKNIPHQLLVVLEAVTSRNNLSVEPCITLTTFLLVECWFASPRGCSICLFLAFSLFVIRLCCSTTLQPILNTKTSVCLIREWQPHAFYESVGDVEYQLLSSLSPQLNSLFISSGCTCTSCMYVKLQRKPRLLSFTTL